MKFFIENRYRQKLAILVEEAVNQKGLVFVMHGLRSWKEEPHMQAFSESFASNDFTVVRFDVANTFGESEGDYTLGTATNFYEDLEDVISWSKTQEWYEEPFWLVGHSMGGMSVARYAENHPAVVKALALISTVVSGALRRATFGKEVLKQWEQTGWLIKHSNSRSEVVKVSWQEMEDLMQYDLLPKAEKLTMPVLMIVGDKDTKTPIEHQEMFYKKLPGKKELYIIQGASHLFVAAEHLEEIKSIIDEWIKSNL
ncbi:MAG: alpha/beta fold hydrolase [Patescibacteria group bacterium]|jgi:pimeloyl-ACP methyl ester carboxylesterase